MLKVLTNFEIRQSLLKYWFTLLYFVIGWPCTYLFLSNSVGNLLLNSLCFFHFSTFHCPFFINFSLDFIQPVNQIIGENWWKYVIDAFVCPLSYQFWQKGISHIKIQSIICFFDCNFYSNRPMEFVPCSTILGVVHKLRLQEEGGR